MFLFPRINLSSRKFDRPLTPICRSQWPRGLRRRSAAARLPRSWVRIPPGTWMFVCCECYVLSGRGLFSATRWSLVRRSPTDCDASLCVIKKPREWGHGPRWAAAPHKAKQTNPHPYSAIVNDWSYTSVYPYAFTAWCWTKHKENCLSCCSDIGLGGLRNTTRISFKIVDATPRFKLGTFRVQVTILQPEPILVTWNQLQLFLDVI